MTGPAHHVSYEADEGAVVLGDAQSLRRVVRGLLDTAVRQLPDTRVQVLVTRDGPHVEVLVRDAGPGLDAHGMRRWAGEEDRHPVLRPGLRDGRPTRVSRAHPFGVRNRRSGRPAPP